MRVTNSDSWMLIIEKIASIKENCFAKNMKELKHPYESK